MPKACTLTKGKSQQPACKHLFVGVEEAQALLHEHPATFEPIGRGQQINPEWLRVNLASADTKQMRELLVEAWRAKARKRVLANFDAAT
jgi:hypothetical protein